MKKTLRCAFVLFLAMLVTFMTACGGNDTGGTPKSSTSGATAVNGNETPSGEQASDKIDYSKKFDNPVTISYYVGQSRFKEAMRTIAKKIKEQHNIEVDFQITPDAQGGNVLKSKLAVGEIPDIVDINTPIDFSEYPTDNYWLELSDQPWVQRLNLDKRLLSDKDDGSIYAMPYLGLTIIEAAWYNVDTLQKIGGKEPETYEEFLDLCELCKKHGIAALAMSNKDLWTAQQIPIFAYWPMALYPNELETYDKILKNERTFSDSKEFIQVLTDYRLLFANGYVNKDFATATYDMAKEYVATGKALMMYNGPWALNDIVAKWPNVKMDSFPIPYAGQKRVAVDPATQGMVISKDSENLEAVLIWINAYSQPENMNLYFDENPNTTPFIDVKSEKLHPAYQKLFDEYYNKDLVAYDMNSPLGIAQQVQSDVQWPLFAELALGTKTPEQVLAEYDAKYADFMKEMKMPGF